MTTRPIGGPVPRAASAKGARIEALKAPRGGVLVEGDMEGCPPPQPTRGFGGAS